MERHLRENVKGTPVDFNDEAIASTTDWPKVKKYYKLNGLQWLEATKDEKEKKKQLEGLILGAMALRGV